MSIEGMQGAWRPLREQLTGFYEKTGPSLREDVPLDVDTLNGLTDTLDQMLRSSERIRQEADEVLAGARGPLYEQVSRLLLAAATIDAMLACDLAALDPEFRLEQGYAAFLEDGVTLDSLDVERNEILAEANALFEGEELEGFEGAEGCASAEALIGEVWRINSELLYLADGPARSLLKGFSTAAAGGVLQFVSAAAHVDVVAQLERAGGVLARHAPRFLREHVCKLVALRAEDTIVDELGSQLVRKVDIVCALSLIADIDGANSRARTRISLASLVTPSSAELLKSDLDALARAYRSQMKWTGRSARWLGHGGPLLSHFVAPVAGAGILCGVFFVGLGWVAYSLTDRVDARNLGFADRVEGVVRLVDRHIDTA
jgi:hypothetical protein